MFSGLLRVFIGLIPLAILVIVVVFLIKAIFGSASNIKTKSNTTASTNNEKNNKLLKEYFNETKQLPLSENVTLLTDNYNSYEELALTYKGSNVCELNELVNVDASAYSKVINLLDDFSTRGKACLKANINSFDISFNKNKKEYKEEYTNAGTVNKPELANVSGNYDYLFDEFKALIENVSYGSENASDYVKGHKEALDHCFSIVCENTSNFNEVEKNISEELEKYESSSIYEKGYYDGLFYCLKAIKKSRQDILTKIGKEIGGIL